MVKTLGLSHLNLNVMDLDRSVRFYQAVFSLELLWSGEEILEQEGKSEGLRQAILHTPGTRDLLALTQAASFPVGPAGLNHFGFIFRSNSEVEQAIAAVKEYGGQVLREGQRQDHGIHEVFAYICDPDGYRIELATQEALLSQRREQA